MNSDRYSVSEVGGDSKSTPQLLGTMGELVSLQQKTLSLSLSLTLQLKNIFVIDSGSFPAAESSYAIMLGHLSYKLLEIRCVITSRTVAFFCTVAERLPHGSILLSSFSPHLISFPLF